MLGSGLPPDVRGRQQTAFLGYRDYRSRPASDISEEDHTTYMPHSARLPVRRFSGSNLYGFPSELRQKKCDASSKRRRMPTPHDTLPHAHQMPPRRWRYDLIALKC